MSMAGRGGNYRKMKLGWGRYGMENVKTYPKMDIIKNLCGT